MTHESILNKNDSAQQYKTIIWQISWRQNMRVVVCHIIYIESDSTLIF